MRAGLVTCGELPELPPDERGLLEELPRLGVAASPLVWDDPSVDWRGWDALVLRSVWDYHLKPAAFRAWLDRLEAAGAPLLNPPALVRENMDKSYLLRLADAGVPIVPTALVRRGERGGLKSLLESRGWPEAVVKPAVSASGWRTRRVSLGRESGESALEEALGASDALVQPFLPEIVAEGEWSFVFLDGEFSHAVLKTAAPGEFRVQADHGGAAVLAEPPAGLLAAAELALSRAASRPLYARVDGIRRKTELLVMELELIEPALFLSLSRGAAERFAKAIASRASRGAAPSR